MSDHTEWIRLPGLFHWEEVSEIFDAHAGHDAEWRFDVRAVAADDPETLYIVLASESCVTNPRRKGAGASSERQMPLP